MPGHIGTSIVANSRKVMTGRDEDALSADDLARARARIASDGRRRQPAPRRRPCRPWSPSSTAASWRRRRPRPPQAATIILDGVKADRWRILVGDDAAQAWTSSVRTDPEKPPTTPEFFEVLAKEIGWRLGG